MNLSNRGESLVSVLLGGLMVLAVLLPTLQWSGWGAKQAAAARTRSQAMEGEVRYGYLLENSATCSQFVKNLSLRASSSSVGATIYRARQETVLFPNGVRWRVGTPLWGDVQFDGMSVEATVATAASTLPLSADDSVPVALRGRLQLWVKSQGQRKTLSDTPVQLQGILDGTQFTVGQCLDTRTPASQIQAPIACETGVFTGIDSQGRPVCDGRIGTNIPPFSCGQGNGLIGFENGAAVCAPLPVAAASAFTYRREISCRWKNGVPIVSGNGTEKELGSSPQESFTDVFAVPSRSVIAVTRIVSQSFRQESNDASALEWVLGGASHLRINLTNAYSPHGGYLPPGNTWEKLFESTINPRNLDSPYSDYRGSPYFGFAHAYAPGSLPLRPLGLRTGEEFPAGTRPGAEWVFAYRLAKDDQLIHLNGDVSCGGFPKALNQPATELSVKISFCNSVSSDPQHDCYVPNGMKVEPTHQGKRYESS
ncbi:MAG: hypothetical protein AB7P04_02220 [Bacteriovoracia bacterium]